VPYLVEESAELIDAVEAGTRADLREELGDLLWQVLFHAAVAADATEDPFDIDDVADALADKMIRRHPHVFGDAVATTPKRCSSTGMPRRPPRSATGDPCSTGLGPHALPRAGAEAAGRAAALPLSSSRTPGGQDRTPWAPRARRSWGGAARARVARAGRGWDAERALRVRIRGLEDEVRAVEASSASDDLEE
jgi:XTP/dITP diphosphohydrolase